MSDKPEEKVSPIYKVALYFVTCQACGSDENESAYCTLEDYRKSCEGLKCMKCGEKIKTGKVVLW